MSTNDLMAIGNSKSPPGQMTLGPMFPNELRDVLRIYIPQIDTNRALPDDPTSHIANWFSHTMTPTNEALAESEKRIAALLQVTEVKIGGLDWGIHGTAGGQLFSLDIGKLAMDHGAFLQGFCIAPLLWEWSQSLLMVGKPDRGTKGIIPAPFAVRISRRMDENYLPGFEPSSGPGPINVTPDMAYLPGLEPETPPTPALILALFDGGGGDSIAPNGPARPTIRIFVEGLLSVQAKDRDGQIRQIPYTVQEIIGWLGWQTSDYRRKKMDPHGELRKALDEVHNIVVPLGDRGGFYRPLMVAGLTGSTLQDKVFIHAVLPRSTVGPPIDRKLLRGLGKRSGLAYRAYLSIIFEWDRYGGKNGKLILPTQPVVERNAAGLMLGGKGEVLVDKTGRPIRSIHDQRVIKTGEREPSPWRTRYPDYTKDDLARLAYPAQMLKDMDLRNARRRALEAFQFIERAGGCEIENIGEGRSRRFRIMPATVVG